MDTKESMPETAERNGVVVVAAEAQQAASLKRRRSSLVSLPSNETAADSISFKRAKRAVSGDSETTLVLSPGLCETGEIRDGVPILRVILSSKDISCDTGHGNSKDVEVETPKSIKADQRLVGMIGSSRLVSSSRFDSLTES